MIQNATKLCIKEKKTLQQSMTPNNLNEIEWKDRFFFIFLENKCKKDTLHFFHLAYKTILKMAQGHRGFLARTDQM